MFGNKNNNHEDIKDPKRLQRSLQNLKEAIAELYLGIKQKTRDEVSTTLFYLVE